MPPTETDDDLPNHSFVDEDAELKAELAKLLESAEVDTPDTSKDGLLAPPDPTEQKRDMVTVEEGLDQLEKARAGQTPAAPVNDIDQQIAQKPAEETPPAPAETPAAPAPAPTADFAALLEGLPDDRKQAITSQLTAGTEVLDLFKGREAELALHGPDITPAKAMARLLDLNDFAQAKPDEYLAWVASQMMPAAPHEVLTAAAKHLGYKLVPDVEEGEEDEFEDDEKKQLKARLKALEAPAQAFGPDAPQNVTAREVTRSLKTFREAKDASGNLLHPLHLNFSAEITEKVKAWRAANPDKIPSAADLSRFYFEVVPGAVVTPPAPQPATPRQPAPAPAQTFAAQPTAHVQEKAQTAAPPKPDRSEAASKMLDGSGPGSDRRPAHSGLTGDQLLRAQLEESMNALKGG